MCAGVEAFFRQQQVAAASTHWQLLQIAPTSTPGTFKVGAPFLYNCHERMQGGGRALIHVHGLGCLK